MSVTEIPITAPGKEYREGEYKAWGDRLLHLWSGFTVGAPYTSAISQMEGRFRIGERTVSWLDAEGHFAYKFVDEAGGVTPITDLSNRIATLEQSAVAKSQWATTARLAGLSALVGLKIVWWVAEIDVPLFGGPLTPGQWGMAAGLLELSLSSPGPWLLPVALVHTFASGQRFLGLGGLFVSGSLWATATGGLTFLLHRTSRGQFAEAYELRRQISADHGWRMWRAITDSLKAQVQGLSEPDTAVDTVAVRQQVERLLDIQGQIRRTYGLLATSEERTEFDKLIRYCHLLKRFLPIFEQREASQDFDVGALNEIVTGEKSIPTTTRVSQERLLQTIGELRRGQNKTKLTEALEAARATLDHPYLSEIESLQEQLNDPAWDRFLVSLHQRRHTDTRIRSLEGLGADDPIPANWSALEVDALHSRLEEQERRAGTNQITDHTQFLRERYPLGNAVEALDVGELNRQRQEVLQSFKRQQEELGEALRIRADHGVRLDELTSDLGAIHAAERLTGQAANGQAATLAGDITRLSGEGTTVLTLYERVRNRISEARHILEVHKWLLEGSKGGAPRQNPAEEIIPVRAERAWSVAKFFASDPSYRDLELQMKIKQVEKGLLSPKAFYDEIDGYCSGQEERFDNFWIAAHLYATLQRSAAAAADSADGYRL